jgi:hypothetical protein
MGLREGSSVGWRRFVKRLRSVYSRPECQAKRRLCLGKRCRRCLKCHELASGQAAFAAFLSSLWRKSAALVGSTTASISPTILRRSNPIESPFAAVRLRTAAAKRYKKVETATAVIWKTLLIAGRTFWRLDAPELLAEVAEGVMYVNGERVKPSQTTADKKAAA